MIWLKNARVVGTLLTLAYRDEQRRGVGQHSCRLGVRPAKQPAVARGARQAYSANSNQQQSPGEAAADSGPRQ